jgi:hypothetical protein
LLFIALSADFFCIYSFGVNNLATMQCDNSTAPAATQIFNNARNGARSHGAANLSQLMCACAPYPLNFHTGIGKCLELKKLN